MLSVIKYCSLGKVKFLTPTISLTGVRKVWNFVLTTSPVCSICKELTQKRALRDFHPPSPPHLKLKFIKKINYKLSIECRGFSVAPVDMKQYERYSSGPVLRIDSRRDITNIILLCHGSESIHSTVHVQACHQRLQSHSPN